MRVRLGKLTLKNFRSHRKSVVDFPTSGMTLVRGKNLDTGESSYTGKSTIGLAISYVLDAGMPFSAKDQKCWYAEGNMSVQLELLTDDSTYTVKRGSQWSVTRPDGVAVTGAPAVKEELRKIFGVYPDMLTPLIYKPQNKAGRFLFMAPADKRDFLAKVLGIQRLEDIAAEAQKKVSGIDADLQTVNYRLAEAEGRARTLGTGETGELVDEEPLVACVDKLRSEVGAAAKEVKKHDDTIRRLAAVREKMIACAKAPFIPLLRGAERLMQEFKVVDPPDLIAALT